MNCEASPTGPPISARPISRPADAAAFWNDPALALARLAQPAVDVDRDLLLFGGLPERVVFGGQAGVSRRVGRDDHAPVLQAVVEEYLHQCYRLNLTAIRIVHGRGIGVQRAMVRKVLERTGFVLSFGDAPLEAGGWGATVITLREHGLEQG